ncbi:MAG: hypothetical protein KatS3mg031_2332 [Chitinophagales bacterium]|nr:MAG: hypothetical protein KatS3mg031_2332 [Chitinophagales bacterium]
MDVLQRNLRWLRTQKKMTQQEFADFLKIKRSSVGAYEEGRARPNLELQKTIAGLFGLTLDELLTQDLQARANKKIKTSAGKLSPNASNTRILAITVDRQGNENIELVSQKAAAGYLSGYSDPEFVSGLPKFRLPFLPAGTYRAFEISGDSMLPLQPGSVVIGEYTDNFEELKDGCPCIILTRDDGIVFKRLFHSLEESKLILRSDNPSYPPLEVQYADVLEIWKAILYITRADARQPATLEQMLSVLHEVRNTLSGLKPA